MAKEYNSGLEVWMSYFKTDLHFFRAAMQTDEYVQEREKMILFWADTVRSEEQFIYKIAKDFKRWLHANK